MVFAEPKVSETDICAVVPSTTEVFETSSFLTGFEEDGCAKWRARPQTYSPSCDLECFCSRFKSLKTSRQKYNLGWNIAISAIYSNEK